MFRFFDEQTTPDMPDTHQTSTPLPFWIPTPIQAGEFIPLSEAHRVFNVQTAPQAIRAFGLTETERSAEYLLHADIQSNIDVNHGLRLGAGRSGFYRGRYLKGVGRTLLASNWNDAEDAYHGTGHLSASAAARELLITSYLDAHDLGHTIARCDGLLAKPLDPALSGFHDALVASSQSPRGALVDAHVMAVTVKEGNFARMSNLTWLLDRAGLGSQAANIEQVFRLLARFSADPGSDEPPGTTPEAIAEQLQAAFERTVDNFRRYFERGVVWCSLHNNFALDGRFVDLELPVVLGGPFAGAIRMGDRGCELVGFEVLQFVQQFALWIRYLSLRLRFNVDMLRGRRLAPFREFGGALAAAIEQRFGEDHLAFDRERQAELVSTWVASSLGLVGGSRRRLQTAAHLYLDRNVGGVGLAHTPEPVELGAHESGTRIRLHRFADIDGPALDGAAAERAAGWAHAVTMVDQCRDVPTYLATVSKVRGRLRSGVAAPRLVRQSSLSARALRSAAAL